MQQYNAAIHSVAFGNRMCVVSMTVKQLFPQKNQHAWKFSFIIDGDVWFSGGTPVS